MAATATIMATAPHRSRTPVSGENLMPHCQRILFLISIAACSLSVHAAEPLPRAEVAGAPVMNGGVLYQFMLGEIAAARRQFPIAVAAYLDLAKRTGDASIARRATEIALASQQFEQAAEAAQLWARADPLSLEAQQAVAATRAEGFGNPDEIEPALREMLRQSQALPTTLLQIPRFYNRFTDRALVLAAIERLTAPYLDQPEAHLVRAAALEAADQKERALLAIEQAMSLRPTWEAGAVYRFQLMSARSSSEALAGLRRFVDATPGAREAEVSYVQGLLDAGLRDEALGRMQRLSDDKEFGDPFRYRLTGVAVRAKAWPLAESLLSGLLARKFGETDLLRLQLGEVQEAGGRQEAALSTYRSIPAGTQYLAALTHIASLQAKRGDLSDALAMLRAKSVELPEMASSLRLAEARLLDSQGQTAQAQALLATWLSASPDDSDVLYQAAMLHEKQGEYESSERLLRRVIEVSPSNPHAYNALGYSLADRNVRLPEADVLLSRALRLKANDAAILDSMGWLRYRQGRLAEALRLLQRAYTQMPDSEVAAHLGEVYWQRGEKARAQQVWAEGARIEPGNKVLLETIKRLTEGASK